MFLPFRDGIEKMLSQLKSLRSDTDRESAGDFNKEATGEEVENHHKRRVVGAGTDQEEPR